MAGLRLDQAESAYARRSGQQERFAIVPGRPDESELIRRITAPTVARRMPPAVTNKVLTPAQVEILRRWIEQGAQYKPHWAYITPAKTAAPPVKNLRRPVNDIDRFVLARLEREGLGLSPETDKETLINRVSLTLTGLPPTLAQVDAFVADRRPDAYERLVDRLLGSQAYAEHMAAYWMNLARWAESDGFLDDHHDRMLWPWRDWVIGAFNRNMRFDEFATWQLAGDLLPNATREQKLATAFLRVGPRTTENGAIDEEYRIEYVVDRTNTIGTAFLGLTVGCARCHDHKYDVISSQGLLLAVRLLQQRRRAGLLSARPQRDPGRADAAVAEWRGAEGGRRGRGQGASARDRLHRREDHSLRAGACGCRRRARRLAIRDCGDAAGVDSEGDGRLLSVRRDRTVYRCRHAAGARPERPAGTPGLASTRPKPVRGGG